MGKAIEFTERQLRLCGNNLLELDRSFQVSRFCVGA